MALKIILILAFACSASAASIPLLSDNSQDLVQRQQNTLLDNQSINNEQLRRQDEYLRNIDHSAVSVRNPNFQHESNRLQDNEYRRTNYYYDGDQQNHNIYQNQEQEQISRQRPDSNLLLGQLLGQPLLITQATNNYPMLRSWALPYNSRVTFNSPLVSYRY